MQADFISHRRGLVRTADLLAYRFAREASVTLNTIVASKYLRDLTDEEPQTTERRDW